MPLSVNEIARQTAMLWRPSTNAALFVGSVSLLVLILALSFEHFGGLKPCPLCLQERYAYYAALGLAGGAALLYDSGRLTLGHLLLGLCALGFAINSGVGVYHAGIEWKFWTGPVSCSGGESAATDNTLKSAADLFNNLDKPAGVSCSDAAWRFLGISFAGYNALISLALAVIGALGIFGPALDKRLSERG